MISKTTKKAKLDELFHQAVTNLSDREFTGWLSFCYGVFGHAVKTNRKVNRYDITLITKELADSRKGGMK